MGRDQKKEMVRNEFFWFDERVPSSEKLDECYKSVVEDFQRLQKNKDFDEYTLLIHGF